MFPCIFKNVETESKHSFLSSDYLKIAKIYLQFFVSSHQWYPSRPGFFYFSFNNGSLTICEEQKLAIKVSLTPPENPATSPELPPRSAPAPISGGVVSSSPAYPWPFLSHGKSLTPSSSPAPKSSPLSPDNGDGEPFINSNPAVPLPTGEVDSATIRPLATSDQAKQVTNAILHKVVFGYHHIVFLFPEKFILFINLEYFYLYYC